MYDDFMSGYNFGSKPLKVDPTVSTKNYSITDQYQKTPVTVNKPGTYDKRKFIRMQGPNGEIGDIFANGKMYIVLGPNKGQVRTFGSRPYAIKYMQSKGWVLV